MLCTFCIFIVDISRKNLYNLIYRNKLFCYAGVDYKLKKRKNFFLCVLAGVLTCSGCLTAGADSTVDAGKLKSGLLLNERNNYQYNIFDYNTNNDQNVNVLDLCRSKAFALEKHSKKTQSINISCLRPWVTSDSSIITIPVSYTHLTLPTKA